MMTAGGMRLPLPSKSGPDRKDDIQQYEYT